jgi:superfamily II DNA/RNA helicase
MYFRTMSKFIVDVKEILQHVGFDKLNEMQEQCLDVSKDEGDILLLSKTGSGKTIAFLLAVLNQLENVPRVTQTLIIVPSRELAQQIELVFRSLKTGLKLTACYGGHKREIEENNLIDAPTLIVGTAGRLCDHIRRGSIHLDSIHTLVLDEFDKSLELGFEEEMKFIVTSLKQVKKRILCSATNLDQMPDFIKMHEPFEVNFLEEFITESAGMDYQYVVSEEKDKIETLCQLLCHIGPRSSIIFCNHRESVERVSGLLKDRSIQNVFYHGAMEQRDRDTALFKFKNGSVPFLVCTDLAARGLDIAHVRNIIHYHIPFTEDTFTHRNGRTARMDASGSSILILDKEEKLPEYIKEEVKQIFLADDLEVPEKTPWTTVYIYAGKKDKINKIDIVGFFTKKGNLRMEEIGLIEVKDYSSFVSIRRSKVGQTMQLVKDQRLKNKKIKIEIAR